MRTHFRLPVALLALMALFLFQAEGLWASVDCAAEMGSGSQVMDASSDTGDCPMGHPEHSHSQDENGPERPDCPLMPGGITSCVGAVALIHSSDGSDIAPGSDQVSVATSDHAKDLLLAVSLLRPPQA